MAKKVLRMEKMKREAKRCKRRAFSRSAMVKKVMSSVNCARANQAQEEIEEEDRKKKKGRKRKKGRKKGLVKE